MGIIIPLSLLVSLVIVFWLAPIADENKPLSTEEVTTLKHKSRISISVCIVLNILIFILFPHKAWTFAFTLGILSIALSLVAGKIKNILLDKPLS
jgi:accessory gene regulator protein AgrB